MIEKIRDRPVFIGGHPKSGTTLLLSILDNHPQLVVYPYETFFFRGYLPQAEKRKFDQKVELASRYILQFTQLRPKMQADYRRYPEEDREFYAFAHMCGSLQRLIDTYGCRHDGDLLAAAVLSFGQVYGYLNEHTRYWVEKSIYNEFFADQIFTWWPQARFIHITRDPRDVYASYHRRHQGLSADKHAHRWTKSSKKGLKNQRKYGRERYLLFRYEYLVQDPEQAIRTLIEFVGIDGDETLRQPTVLGIPWEGNSMFLDRFQGISSRPAGRWKKELSPLETQVIENIAGSLMDALGYAPEMSWSLAASWHILRGRISRYREAFQQVDHADLYRID